MKVAYKVTPAPGGKLRYEIYCGEFKLPWHGESEAEARIFCQGFTEGAKWYYHNLPAYPTF